MTSSAGATQQMKPALTELKRLTIVIWIVTIGSIGGVELITHVHPIAGVLWGLSAAGVLGCLKYKWGDQYE